MYVDTESLDLYAPHVLVLTGCLAGLGSILLGVYVQCGKGWSSEVQRTAAVL